MSRRKATPATVGEIVKAFELLPPIARDIVREHIKDLDEFRRRYPRLFELMFRPIHPRMRRRQEAQYESACRDSRASRNGGEHA